ncbi:hypothetical protein M9H77_26543 [Catharanthus roseus]|uniref:Uncharacterized protein n=1 Tax=Catharanthus roseus TaxID=4058 RepID=A0ACC0ABH4_CATRO|nr:hypothetical protein M9H77_26543 [Catharanthus roseus]
MYRVYYRLLSSQLNPRFKMIPTSRDETVLLHIEAEQSKTFTPKRLKWHEITIPDEFQIENPHPFPHIERNEISQIIEEPNGNVLIRFNSVREQESGSTIPIEPSRHSFAQSRRRSFAESSEQSFRMPNSIHVHHTAPIPEVSTSPPLSPTASQMKDDSDVDSHPEDFQDSSSTDDVINMIRHSSNTTVKDQKELIFDIIQDLPPEAQKKQLEKLKTLILREESSSARLVEPFSISKMFERYPHMNPQIRQHSTKELQTEINSLKAQDKELKERDTRTKIIEWLGIVLSSNVLLIIHGFFIFHQHCSKDFPIWFYEWWINFGSLPDILPPIPKLGFQTWLKKMTGPSYAIPLQFYAELRVPWIFCWSYKIDQIYSKDYPMSLTREFKIKWWTGYSVELCSQDTVLQFIQQRHLLQRSIQQLSKGATHSPSSVQTTAPAIPSPLKQESSISKLTTEDADEAQQFQEFLRFKAFQQQMKKQASQSPTSSQDSSTDPFGGPCAQDPFDI